MGRWRRGAVVATAVLGLGLAAVGCTEESPAPRPEPSSASAPQVPETLTLGVFGPDAEVDAFRRTLDTWNDDHPDGPRARLRAWPDQRAMREDLESGAPVPDVFMAPRSDMAWLLQERYTQPVDELLDERGVDFGDGYSRDSLQAFSTDDRLQCMPYAVSPMVIFYNARLVNFDRMRNRGLDAPDSDANGWSFEQFAAAARFASRPERGTKGVHIAPTLEGLAPFIESGGGSVFDDGTDPTSLNLSGDDSRAALEETLPLLRDPQLTLDESQLAQASPLRWFERGKLGMIAGYRSLVPQLRLVPGLDFDIMPMPSLDGAATVGDVSGLCLSRTAASTPLAADLLVHEVSAPAVTEVTRTGYLAPANLQVALSASFSQPGRLPEHAIYFTSSVRSIRLDPLVDTLPAVQDAVRGDLRQLVYGIGVLDLDAVTQRIDEESRAILDPESLSESPSPSGSGSSSG